MLPEKIFSATTLLEGNLTFLNDAKLLTAPLSQPLLTFVSAMAVTRGKISPMAVTKAICLEFGFYYSHN